MKFGSWAASVTACRFQFRGDAMSLLSKLKRELGITKKKRSTKKAKKRRTPPRKKNGELRKRK